MCTAVNGHAAVARQLVDARADATLRATGGWLEGKTALEIAEEEGHDEIAALLRRVPEPEPELRPEPEPQPEPVPEELEPELQPELEEPEPELRPEPDHEDVRPPSPARPQPPATPPSSPDLNGDVNAEIEVRNFH